MAGRPRTPIGTWGDINVRQVAEGTHEARARFRDPDGRLRLVSARGPSASAAKGALRDRLAARAEARAARDFAAADAIRDELAAAGVEVTDTAEGQKWSLADRKER